VTARKTSGEMAREAVRAHASRLGVLAYPLMPADPARRGEVVEAPPDWSFDSATFDPEAYALVWGRMPDASPSLRSAALRAAAREAALREVRRRVPSHLRLVAVHRLPPRRLDTGGLRGILRTALRGGALVELSSLPDGARVLDRVLVAAEATGSESGFGVGAGGSMLLRVVRADGTGGWLRLARAGTPGDPARSADTLERLAGIGIPVIPRVLTRGRTAGASWSVEGALPGRRPARTTRALVQQLEDICVGLPRGDGPPTATAADLAGIAGLLPDRADAVGRLAADLSDRVRALSSVLRHGDLWTGNILVKGGRLTGLIDWDAAHPAAVPGADLLQFAATEFRRRAHCALGPAFLSRPWRLPIFLQATRVYWPALGIRPDDALLEVVGIAWWATEVHGTLSRLPHRAADEAWVATNVDRVVAALGY
jgi:hypothetical protein